MRNTLMALGLMCVPTTTALGQVTFVPSDLSPGDQYHVAFVTFTGFDAESTDITDYNAFVQEQAGLEGADTEGWGVDWFAIASTSAIDAKDSIPVDAAPVYMLSDDRLADDAADLWDGSIQDLLSYNQFGDFESSAVIWTGTASDGTAFPLGPLGADEPRQGFTGVATSGWVSFGNEPADNARAFYAVSAVLTVPGASECPEDLNEDGNVDGADLGLLLGNWGGSGTGDLNEDGTVDGADLGLLLGAWGECE